VQPTDQVRSVFVFLSTKTARRGSGDELRMLQQGLVGRTEGWDRQMRSRILSMLATLGALAALALAGGASLRGF
jgi:hypothetical protein